MKIICAGLQKTGTKSIAEALRILGYDVHDAFEQLLYDRELWDKIVANTVTTEDYQRILRDVDAVIDWPAVAVWEQIMEAFPDAKVILTIRSNEDEWYGSMKNQCKVTNNYVPSRYRQHNLYVNSICPEKKLLIYNVKEGWEPLCRFLNKEIPEQTFPKVNVKGEIMKKLMNNKWKYNCGFQKTVERQTLWRMAEICFVLITLFFVWYII
uniref:uncharacterized protein LOC120339504 isoform X2 n=1 Tax=Styela clava TaxID=7725 RepID=UPI001939850A|nr:uncharacterized protein LOC120339504 isoform X2 [Styela clava]